MDHSLHFATTVTTLRRGKASSSKDLLFFLGEREVLTTVETLESQVVFVFVLGSFIGRIFVFAESAPVVGVVHVVVRMAMRMGAMVTKKVDVDVGTAAAVAAAVVVVAAAAVAVAVCIVVAEIRRHIRFENDIDGLWQKGRRR